MTEATAGRERSAERAYHEAGHAVVMVARRMPLGDVSIAGRAFVEQPHTDDWRAVVAAGLAGCIAEDRFCGVADPTRRAIEGAVPVVHYHTHDEEMREHGRFRGERFRYDRLADDFKIVGRSAVRATGGALRPETREAALAVVYDEAAGALRDIEAGWAAVAALAEALLERETVPAAEARGIIDAN